MQWLRLYSEARVDRKLQSLSDAQFRVWFNLLCFANEQADRGRFTLDDVELLAIEVAGGDVDLLTETIERLRKLRILSDDAETGEFRNFEKRQYDKPSDRPERVAERVRKHRETKKQANVTPCNAPYTETDTEKETDTEGANAPKRARAKSPNYTPEFEEFWQEYPSGFGSKKVAFARWCELRPDALLRAEIMAGLRVWKQSDRWERGFIKAAELWLRDRLWENPPPSRGSAAFGGKSSMETTMEQIRNVVAGRNGSVPAEETADAFEAAYEVVS